MRVVSTPPTSVLSVPVNFARSDPLSLAISANTVAAASVVPEPPIEDAKVAALLTTDSIEAIGVRKSLEKMKSAAIMLYLFDVREQKEDHEGDLQKLRDQMSDSVAVLTIGNKTDLATHDTKADVLISAKTGLGLDELRKKLVETIQLGTAKSGDVVVTNARHLEALKATDTSLSRALDGLESGLSGDLVASDIGESLYHLGSITGEITTEDLLGNIFGKFCIGK